MENKWPYEELSMNSINIISKKLIEHNLDTDKLLEYVFGQPYHLHKIFYKSIGDKSCRWIVEFLEFVEVDYEYLQKEKCFVIKRPSRGYDGA